MMLEFRQEHDSLGIVNVPKHALFGAQTQRAVENFPISGKKIHPSLIRAYLRIKHAAATANLECKALTREQAHLIHRAIDDLLNKEETEWKEIFPVDAYQAGAGTSQNMNFNEVIANRANQISRKPLGSYSPIHPNDHVNRSQSTNDTYPTAIRLALLELSKTLVQELNKLSLSFKKKANQWKNIPKSGRTHLQDAVPMTLRQEFLAYSGAIRSSAQGIETSRRELLKLGIGGSAAGTGLTVPPRFIRLVIPELRRLTQEHVVSHPDLCQAMQSQFPVCQLSAQLKLMSIELTRICNDLRLLASGPMTGFNEILLPAVQPGSSIMPGKVNPSILEMANQTWYSVMGYDQTVAMCGQAGQLELNVMMPMMAYSVLEATHVSIQTVRVLREKCIDGLQANVKRLRHYFESTPQVATAISPKLGYEKTAHLVSEALEHGRSVIDWARAQNLLPEEELKEILSTLIQKEK